MIQNENELKIYLKEIGLSTSSSSNYRSRIKFLIRNGIDINSNTINASNVLDLEEIRKRDYKHKNSLNTALTTYHRFLSSDFNLLRDINEINQREISTTKKEALINARIGQGEFRKKLITLWQKCSVSQFPKT